MNIRRSLLLAAFPLAVALVAAGQGKLNGWLWPESMDALQAAPKNHRLVYEDDNVRILEVSGAAGETEPGHTHRWPSLLLVDHDAKYDLKYSCSDTAFCASGEVVKNRPSPNDPYPLVLRLAPQGPHAVAMSTTAFHGYRIEYKKLDASRFKN
jgi:hypothetical protein